MIFNLNGQKVLSDPSGSSVFKGEKDFNDIVVNLPDEIDGHTATELNYVMHFVDSDGGYSTKILTVDSSGETLEATATVSTSITSKAQAFYAYVLMTDDEETVIGKTNGVIVMIHPVPDEENEIIPPADADKIIKGLEEIVKEATETIEEATEAISSKQDKLTAGENITISSDNVISAEGGVTSYEDLTDKPSINDISLEGNKSASDLGLQMIINNYFTVENNEYREYDFNSISLLSPNSVMYCVPFSRVRNFPNSLSDKIRQSGVLYIFHYVHTTVGAKYLIRRIMGRSPSGNYAEFAQYCTVADSSDSVISQSEWVELTGGGSQIVSGVVNANGTITFTDSDGNTFTTTGSNLVTSGNEQISVGYDNGGFYFLFDDGQEA